MKTIPKNLDGVSEEEILEILSMENSEQVENFKKLVLKRNYSNLARYLFGEAAENDSDIHDYLKDSLKVMPEIEATIIRYTFGLNEKKPIRFSLKETGEQLKPSYTPERVCQVQAKGLRRMRYKKSHLNEEENTNATGTPKNNTLGETTR